MLPRLPSAEGWWFWEAHDQVSKENAPSSVPNIASPIRNLPPYDLYITYIYIYIYSNSPQSEPRKQIDPLQWVGFVERTHFPSEMGSFFSENQPRFHEANKSSIPWSFLFLVAEIVMGFWLDWFFEGLSYLGEKYSYLGFCQFFWSVLEMCFYRHYSRGKVVFFCVVELRCNPRWWKKCVFGACTLGDFQGPISCWLFLHLHLFKEIFYFLPW